jgi:hypothetical protein
MPRLARSPESWLMEAMPLAVTDGWRLTGFVTLEAHGFREHGDEEAQSVGEIPQHVQD